VVRIPSTQTPEDADWKTPVRRLTNSLLSPTIILVRRPLESAQYCSIDYRPSYPPRYPDLDFRQVNCYDMR